MYSPVSACGRGCLPHSDATRGANPLVRVGRIVALVVALLGGVGIAAALPVLSTRGRARALRRWFRLILAAAGVRLQVSGADLRSVRPLSGSSGTLVAANHVSWLDIPAILAVEPMSVLAKSDVRDWPVVGLMAARGGTIFIDRRHLLNLPTTIAEIAGSLRSDRSVLVFPEGSTWCGRTQGRFYPATFQAAVDAHAPVRPVTLRYLLGSGAPTTAAAFVGDDTLLAAVWRVAGTRGLVVEVEVGAVLPADHLATAGRVAPRRELSGGAATVIRRAVADIHHPVPV
jgi:1-acyl-sn-glycerol-3-phosphate acyltransferase